MTRPRGGTTVEFGGRTFPTVTVICPPQDGEDTSEWDRSLGAGKDNAFYVPSENGLLFEIEWTERRDGSLMWSLHLLTSTCELLWAGPHSEDEPPYIYLPMSVYLHDGELTAVPRPPDLRRQWPFNAHGITTWEDADPEWIAETIDRLAHKPFRPPQGPKARLVAKDDVEKASNQ